MNKIRQYLLSELFKKISRMSQVASKGKDQWGVQALLYESFHGLYPDLPRTTHFKQKRAQKSTL